jgi:O-antigen ligase
MKLSAGRIFENLGFAGALFLVSGLVYSPAMQSIGIGLMFLHFFFNLPVSFKPREHYLKFLLVALFLINLVSGLYAHNQAEYWKKIILMLPLLMLPVAFFSPNILSGSRLKIVILVYILTVFSCGCITLGDYIIHYDYINEQLLHSKPIYILFDKINHIYYSVLLAFSIWACLYLFFENSGISKAQRPAMAFLAATQLILLHVIAARTGVAAFYAAGIIGLIWLMIIRKKILLGILLCSCLGILFLTAYAFLPAWHNRTINAREDLSHIDGGKDINYRSIAMRKEALKTAWKLHEKNPLLGVGTGDLEDEMNRQYEADNTPLLPENRKLPHNQFIQELVTTGIIGLIILLAVFIVPFSQKRTWQNIFFPGFLVIAFTACQVESLLERQVGITFFTFFYLAVPLYLLQSKNEITAEGIPAKTDTLQQ